MERKQEKGKNKEGERNQEKQFTAVRLHIELKSEYLSEHQSRMLRRYGESLTGDSISRDILIPSDMPLHNLHYAIQKLYGWQNSHLRCFQLPEEVYQKLTGGTVKGWTDLVGILFQPPSEAEEDIFWDDDYRSGSVKSWLKKKYTGPYFYGSCLEDYDAAKNDVDQLLERFPMVEVQESFHDYMERKRRTGDETDKILRKAPLIDLTLKEMIDTIYIENGTENLLERLLVSEVLAAPEEILASEKVFPVTRELFYHYDFGDNWIVKITKKNGSEDLIKAGVLSREELTDANETVLSKHKPVCIHKAGVFVLDNVGGLEGFADFLGTIYESDDKEERAGSRTWAQSLGWNMRKISNKMVL